MKNIIIALFGLLILSCNTTKSTDSGNDSVNVTIQDDTEQKEIMLAEHGFVKAVVVDMRGTTGCGYVLKTEDGKLYAPKVWIDTDNRENGKTVYVLFEKTTEKSGCSKATMVDLKELKFIR